MRKKFAGALQEPHRQSKRPRIKTALSEDQRKRIGDQTIIVNDQHSLLVISVVCINKL